MEIAAVVGALERCREGHLLRFDEIPPPDLRGIEAELASGMGHHALQDIGRLRSSGAAISIDRRRMSVGAVHFDKHGRRLIDARVHRAAGAGRDEGAEER